MPFCHGLRKLVRLGSTPKLRKRANDFLIEVRAPVEDQVAGRRIVWKRFVQLLSDPGTPRMFGDVAVENLSPVVRDDKEAVQHAEG